MKKSHRRFLAILLFVEVFLVVLPIDANSAPRRIAIFVNGDQNCCAENMNKTREALLKLGMEVDYSAWNSITAHNMGSNPRNTQNFIKSATNYFNSLPQGTEVYLIGHSFGGDSILQLLGSYRRSHVKFRLVAILDAVGNSGRRDITKQNRVPSNVDYFFNRWQKNAPWPVDIDSSGNIECHAKTCDQKEQSFSRAPDGKTRTKECTRVEACPGAGIRKNRNGLPFYYSGVKKTRLHHSYVPTDPYIEQQIISIVTNLVKHPPKTKNFTRVGSGNEWKIAPITIATQGKFLYVIENATLFRVNPNTGAYQGLGKNWSKSPIAMTALGKFLYVIENATLFRVNPNTGAYQGLGKNWSKSPIAMTALGKFLYVIENATLYRVNPNTGAYQGLGKNWSKSPIAMTALGKFLYVIENATLYRVNPNTGAYQGLGKNWSKSPIAMTALGKFLYVIENATLYRVNPNSGKYDNLGKDWSKGPIALTAFRSNLYIVENKSLWKVN